MRMIANKPMTYGTRRLTAGEEFDVRPHHVRILKATKKISDAPQPVIAAAPAVHRFVPAAYAPIAPEPQAVATVSDAQQPPIVGLRTAAEKLGIPVDGRWSATRLQREIDAKQGGADTGAVEGK